MVCSISPANYQQLNIFDYGKFNTYDEAVLRFEKQAP